MLGLIPLAVAVVGARDGTIYRQLLRAPPEHQPQGMADAPVDPSWTEPEVLEGRPPPPPPAPVRASRAPGVPPGRWTPPPPPLFPARRATHMDSSAHAGPAAEANTGREGVSQTPKNKSVPGCHLNT